MFCHTFTDNHNSVMSYLHLKKKKTKPKNHKMAQLQVWRDTRKKETLINSIYEFYNPNFSNSQKPRRIQTFFFQ